MKIKTQNPSIIPGNVLAELAAAAKRAASGIRDPEEMRKACESMDAIAEGNRKKLGVQSIGVAIIRELRGPLAK